MEKFTNRDLARISEKSLVQIKRDSVLALGVDPLTGSASGKVREYSLNDAFLLYLFTRCLVTDQRLERDEAKKYFILLKESFEKENLHYENFVSNENEVIYSNPEIKERLNNFQKINREILGEALPIIMIKGYVEEITIERIFPFIVGNRKFEHEVINYVFFKRYVTNKFKIIPQERSIFSINLILEYYKFQKRL